MTTPFSIAIIGGGPAGLMAAEVLSRSLSAKSITIYERKASFGRKFLLAGRGGLNITHSEDIGNFVKRYADAADWMQPMLDNFSPIDMRDWCLQLGEETFVGTSGRVFPKSFKSSPLLRAWQKRLEQQGVIFKTSHDWRGWDDAGQLLFNDNEKIKPDATLFALGGASWARMGSDGSWVSLLEKKNIDIKPLLPANSGFTRDWSQFFATRFAGTPLKAVTLHFAEQDVKGEAMITERGIEGSAIYAFSRLLRESIVATGYADLHIDLKPDASLAALADKLSAPRRGLSLSNMLRKSIGLSPVAIGLLRESTQTPPVDELTGAQLAARIKKLVIRLDGLPPIDRAISTAGGVALTAVDSNLMLKNLPGTFVSGEMLDWEAPTGGYLLQGTFATAVTAAKGMLDWINKKL